MSVATSVRFADRSIPHPILDDPVKMRRIIANPVYDKLTVSRAAHVRIRNPTISIKRPERAKSIQTPMKSLSHEQTFLTPLSGNNHPPDLKGSSKHAFPLPFRLCTPSSQDQQHSTSRHLRSSSQSQRFPSSKAPSSDRKIVVDGSIRYVNTSHGFEIQHYSSKNWLTVDVISKEACRPEERSFREMLEKKHQAERLSDSIYTSAYYRQRWYELLQSYRRGDLTHEEWAVQNYQLYCLKNFYANACDREQSHTVKIEEDERQKRASSAFHQWKETKSEENPERQRSRLTTANSQQPTEVNSIFSANSFSAATGASNRESDAENKCKHPVNRLSISSIPDQELEDISCYRPKSSLKRHPSIESYIMDQQRWTLGAMLKRVVGLTDPLPSPRKPKNYSHSSITQLSSDSGFESSV